MRWFNRNQTERCLKDTTYIFFASFLISSRLHHSFLHLDHLSLSGRARPSSDASEHQTWLRLLTGELAFLVRCLWSEGHLAEAFGTSLVVYRLL